jgi:RNA polymerase sigma factor (TIGR02999 family)
MPDQTGDITRLLRQWRDGDSRAENLLFELVHGDLKRLARFRMKGERKAGSLQATELVDQIYIRLTAAKDRDWRNRQHFFALAGRAMRHYLIDIARSRPDAEMVNLDTLAQTLPAGSVKVDLAITVGKLLDQMEKAEPAWCNLVELKFFLGLTDEEAANVLGIKLRSMQRMWHDARRWLFERMDRGNGQQISG